MSEIGELHEVAGRALPTQADTMSRVDDFRSMAQDPKHRRRFEKFLYLAVKRGDTALGWMTYRPGVPFR